MMPTNLIAQNSLNAERVPHKVFPNLAHRPIEYGYQRADKRDRWDASVVAEVTAACEAELQAARINVAIMPLLQLGEVPSLAVGSLSGWTFERRWYYWTAEGPGIPCDIAERLHASHGKEVRVEGHCGCPSPREWRKGFAIGSYHVDTQEGLNALADTLRSIYDASKDPDAKPFSDRRLERLRQWIEMEQLRRSEVGGAGMSHAQAAEAMGEKVLAPGVHGHLFDTQEGIYIPIITSDCPGSGDVGRFLDSLPKDRTVKFPTVMSDVLSGMLRRRGFVEAEEFDDESGAMCEMMVRRHESAGETSEAPVSMEVVRENKGVT
jgi:hypothetical protein